MIATEIDWVIDWENVNKAVALIVSQEEPVSLNITGADVDGLPDDCVIAAGSMLVSPTANYIAFEDGVFTEKSNGGGSGGGGGGDSIVVTHIDDNGVLGMTFSEVVSAVATGKLVLCIDKTSDDDYSYDVYYIMQTYPRGDDPVYYCVNLSSGDELSTDSLNGYPAYGE